MRVWVIKSGENIAFENSNARPMRIGILAKMLAQNGHEVTWWTSSVDHLNKSFYPQSSQQEYFLPCGTKLIFLSSILYEKNISLKRLINHFGVARHFNKLAPCYPRPDVVLCCFPTTELSYSAVNFCKKYKIPIIVDIRDLYPDVFINLFPSFLRFAAKIIFYPMLLMTKKIMKQATGITAISNTYLQWGLRHRRRKETEFDGVFPLAYPQEEETIFEKAFVKKFSHLKNKKIILYIGNFINSIDLETVISAAKLLEKENKDQFHFILAGDGERRKKLERMAVGLNNVTFTGWVNFHQIIWLSNQAWVGLGAYKKDALMSLPNKIFEYMSFGLPIVSCLQGETKEIIEKYNCGLYYEAGNINSLIYCLERLNLFPAERHAMGEASLHTYNHKYSSAVIYNDMMQHILKIGCVALKDNYTDT